MTDTTTKENVRRAIAEALGYKAEIVHGMWAIVAPDGYVFRFTGIGIVTEESIWQQSNYPDWPNDPGAALVLCLEIADYKRYDRLICETWHRPKGTYFAQFTRLGDRMDGDPIFKGEGATPAEALSNLALDALQSQAVADG